MAPPRAARAARDRVITPAGRDRARDDEGVDRTMASNGGRRMTKRQYEALADFRYQLRRFLRYSEQITRRHGMTPLQYQLLLQVKGYPGREQATVTELAERLQAQHHGIVALVTRCERLGLVERRAGTEDRRTVYVSLTPKGRRALEKLAWLHMRELLSLQERFLVPDARLLAPQRSPGRPARARRARGQAGDASDQVGLRAVRQAGTRG